MSMRRKQPFPDWGLYFYEGLYSHGSSRSFMAKDPISENNDKNAPDSYESFGLAILDAPTSNLLFAVYFHTDSSSPRIIWKKRS